MGRRKSHSLHLKVILTQASSQGDNFPPLLASDINSSTRKIHSLYAVIQEKNPKYSQLAQVTAMELATDLGCPATDLFGVSVIACSEKPTKGCFLQTHSRADKTKFYSENAIKFQYAASSKFCIKSHLRYQMALGG